MARLVRTSRRFLKTARRCGVLPQSRESREVWRTVHALETAPALPLKGDVYTFVPNETTSVQTLAHGHRVPGSNFWVWYWATDDEVQLVALTKTPPIVRV